jgi:acetyl-CoA carboxylase biotin carboxyl carrier protein
MPLDDDDVREILRLIDESEVEELRVETDGLSLYVRRRTGLEAEDPVQRAPRPEEPAPAPREPDGVVDVTAPMIGTFYRAPAPGAPPFVDVGSRVEPGTVVCLIEVMKMMNSVPAGMAGTIVEVCAENAQVVELGTPLFRVRPHV